MSLAILVYLIALLDNISIAIAPILAISLMTLIISSIVYCATNGNSYEVLTTLEAKKWAKRAFIVLCLSNSIKILLPSEKTAYVMVGAYAAQKIAEDPKVQQLSGKVLTIVEQKLDSYIAEASKTTKP